jgi:ribosomal protein S5
MAIGASRLTKLPLPAHRHFFYGFTHKGEVKDTLPPAKEGTGVFHHGRLPTALAEAMIILPPAKEGTGVYDPHTHIRGGHHRRGPVG